MDQSSTSNMGSVNSKKGNARPFFTSSSQRVETLVLTTPVEIERAMSAVTLPKRVDIRASLLSHAKGSSVEKILKRVGCLELCIQGKNAMAPRRVFEHEVVAAISHVKQHKLQKVILKNLDIQRLENQDGSAPEDGSSLQKCLQKLCNLEELHIQSCRLDSALKDVMYATDALPQLRQVTLNLCDAVENTDDKDLLMKTMLSLLQRPRLTSLAVSEHPENESFWKLISTTTTLTHLSLALRQDLEQEQQQSFWDRLQQNTSIEQLELQVAPGIPLTPLMQLLKKNTTIVSLLLHLEEDPIHVSQTLAEVLEYHNFTLHKVHLLCHNIYGYKVRIPCRRLDFLTKLNRRGRRHLLMGMQQEQHSIARAADGSAKPQDTEWIDAMAANTYDVSSTFYWLRSNPNLFSCVAY